MATQIRKRTEHRKVIRFKHKKRIRSKLSGTSEVPRLSLFRSNKRLYVQLTDDVKGHTLASASTLEEELRGKKVRNNVEGSKTLGELIARRALAKNVKKVVFDRSGYIFHGRVKALAEAAREAGLQF